MLINNVSLKIHFILIRTALKNGSRGTVYQTFHNDITRCRNKTLVLDGLRKKQFTILLFYINLMGAIKIGNQKNASLLLVE